MFAICNKTKVLISGIVLFTLLLNTSMASAADLGYGTQDILITVEQGQDAIYIVPMAFGDHLLVELRVTAGGVADFFLTNLTAYNVYRASIDGNIHLDSLYYLPEYSEVSTKFIQYNYGSLNENEMVVVIDNTGFTQPGAMPDGALSVEGTISVEHGIWTPVNIAVIVAVAISVIVIAVSLKLRQKRRSSTRKHTARRR